MSGSPVFFPSESFWLLTSILVNFNDRPTGLPARPRSLPYAAGDMYAAALFVGGACQRQTLSAINRTLLGLSFSADGASSHRGSAAWGQPRSAVTKTEGANCFCCLVLLGTCMPQHCLLEVSTKGRRYSFWAYAQILGAGPPGALGSPQDRGSDPIIIFSRRSAL